MGKPEGKLSHFGDYMIVLYMENSTVSVKTNSNSKVIQ